MAYSDDIASRLMVIPLYIPEKALVVLGDIAAKKGTTVGSMINEALRNIVKQELGEANLAELEVSI